MFALGTFLDVEGAFDNASFDSMVEASQDPMLRCRTVTAEVRGVSSTMEVRKGCPLGDALSPVLMEHGN
jgi:hypothetical protein